jgi:hypothetical protein
MVDELNMSLEKLWNENDREELKYLQKVCSRTTWSTINPHKARPCIERK